ncbi:hypothetical protein AUK11_03725 [bacterium CG2_30_37_16]|nr:MAG: hypothetical protein AUK11_03725 [bacterium CG2_30_37_16]PIP31124.1 MAG: hypothetical protein COX25_01005 [bacterium (Candidatus Howlettbacteria) CG23_combo_of_CG06-09_8_20_14_all_37_9]PJB06055.1 MAG: hypothetical protein CO123_02845 [bacterium (Candidatus Howlettbacteria) CG_4_9_14_3_um_filter_37_10]
MGTLYILPVIFVILTVTVTVTFIIRSSKYYRKQIERSLKMVPFLVTIPQTFGNDKRQGVRDERDLARELISLAENFYYSLYSIYSPSFKNLFFGQKHTALEIVAADNEIRFYFAVPISLVGIVEKTLSAQYPDAYIEETEEHNIFFKGESLKNIYGGMIKLGRKSAFPIKTFQQIDLDPLDPITNSLSKLDPDEGAAIQVLIRPTASLVRKSKRITGRIQKGDQSDKVGSLDPFQTATYMAKDVVMAFSKKTDEPKPVTPMQEEVIRNVEKKVGKPVFETVIRVMISAKDPVRGHAIENEIAGAFSQFNDLHSNFFVLKRARNKQKLVNDYVFRFFDEHHTTKMRKMILNTEELASIYHLPNYQITTPGIKWLPARKTAAPVALPAEGTILGESIFRGETKDVRLALNDQRRHMYILGQTGTGKTNTLKNMILDEINKGHGICYIDPHGQDLDDILNKIPKERAEDVILFDAGDTDMPIGLNLFEAKTIEQQDFVIQEAIQMLYKLYDPGHTGIMGPRFEHWFRNAALTVMADPEGGTFLEVPKIFTDNNYLKKKLEYVTDPIVRNFWLNEMAQTSDFHKSEVLGWFVGKFGAFMTNTTMRNILGQVDSTFKIREAMDSGKIVLINLAKGKVGELNMQLLGMVLISKFQMAAMSRIDTPEEKRRDFTLYVDEFQNFATDSFAAILSEARKFRFSLVVANQFIGQLKEEIKNAVFGNVGSIICFRVGPEDAEFMAKQFDPVFTVSDMINIENYHAFIKLMVNGLPARPFTMKGKAPMGATDLERGNAIKQLARLKYGRDRALVDKEILAKISLGDPVSQPPK